MLPPGRERLATKPSPTGSDTIANTIGIVCVSRCNAAVTGVPNARITSGLRPTNSFANYETSGLASAAKLQPLPPEHRFANRREDAWLFFLRAFGASGCPPTGPPAPRRIGFGLP